MSGDGTLPPTEDFGGACLEPISHAERFELRRRIGSGGSGVVYEAFDRKWETTVALKTLQHSEPWKLSQFKLEFRTAAQIRHINLVKLFEFFGEPGATWFFTMEMLQGTNCIAYLNDAADLTQRIPRVIALLTQLVDGISALHARRTVHRDIKPDNVFVTTKGRVVILDFGIAADAEHSDTHYSFIAGTPAYMAPEQFQNASVTTAADWYSVGVLLYEALTGTCPFTGSVRDIRRQKESGSLPPLAGIPPPLWALCIRMLAYEPLNRPTVAEIRTTINELLAAGDVDPVRTHDSAGSAFQGREHHLKTLEHAFLSTQQRRSVLVNIVGRSGLGKSALLQQFVRHIRHCWPEALVLSGRCPHNETVPFKAVDSIIDKLAAYLRSIKDDLPAFMPADFHLVARLFPVLAEIQPEGSKRGGGSVPTDFQELRKRAFIALIRLLDLLAERRPVMICVDDLQWGDLDSAAFLNTFLATPTPPNLLLVGSYRREDTETSPFLRAYQSSIRTQNKAVQIITIDVEELPPDEALALAVSLVQDSATAPYTTAEIIATQSGGSPFLIERFARYVASHPVDSTSLAKTALDLNAVFREQIAQLPQPATVVLEIVALAAQPLRDSVAAQAAQLETGGQEVISMLEGESLLRSREHAGHTEVETYHDKIREIVCAAIPPDRAQSLHDRIATALKNDPQASDPAALAFHCERAGHATEAATYAVAAARNAGDALAFDRAAHLYRVAIRLGTVRDQEQVSLYRRLGDALVNAGRGAEAGQVYLQAAQEGGTGALELQRCAGEQFLRSGHIERGLQVLEALAHAAHIRMPKHTWSSLLLLGVRRFLLKVRGLKFSEQHTVDASVITRLDIYWSLVIGFTMVEPMRGAGFHAGYLLSSLRSGNPYRIGLGLAYEVSLSTFLYGEQNYRRAMHIRSVVAGLAIQLKSAHVLAHEKLQGATSACLTGRWRTARDLAKEAAQLFSEQCTGVAWEIATARVFWLSGLAWLGEWKEMGRRATEFLADSEDRGDLYATTQLKLVTPFVYYGLSADRPDEAQSSVLGALSKWPNRGVDLPRLWAVYGQCEVLLYQGYGTQAWARLSAEWKLLARSIFFRGEMFSSCLLYLRARAALGAACASTSAKARKKLVKIARRSAQLLSRHPLQFGPAAALLITAGLNSLIHNDEAATRALEDAEGVFTLNEMGMFQAAVRWRRGHLIGGSEGKDLINSAEEFMHEQGVVNPAGVTRMLIAGDWKS